MFCASFAYTIFGASGGYHFWAIVSVIEALAETTERICAVTVGHVRLYKKLLHVIYRINVFEQNETKFSSSPLPRP